MLYPKFKIGVEAEFLIVEDKNESFPVSVEHISEEYLEMIPHDDFDMLAEARSKPSAHPNMVWGSLMGEIDRIKNLLPDRYSLSTEEYPFNVDFYWQQVLRCNTSYGQYKGDVVGGNVYGAALKHVSKDGIIHRGGGVHLHFSAYIPDDGVEKYLFLPVSVIATVTRALDDKYSGYLDGCQNAYRQPGFWRRKPHGFEYRSLPASSDVMEDIRDIIVEGFGVFKEEMTRRS